MRRSISSASARFGPSMPSAWTDRYPGVPQGPSNRSPRTKRRRGTWAQIIEGQKRDHSPRLPPHLNKARSSRGEKAKRDAPTRIEQACQRETAGPGGRRFRHPWGSRRVVNSPPPPTRHFHEHPACSFMNMPSWRWRESKDAGPDGIRPRQRHSAKSTCDGSGTEWYALTLVGTHWHPQFPPRRVQFVSRQDTPQERPPFRHPRTGERGHCSHRPVGTSAGSLDWRDEGARCTHIPSTVETLSARDGSKVSAVNEHHIQEHHSHFELIADRLEALGLLR